MHIFLKVAICGIVTASSAGMAVAQDAASPSQPAAEAGSEGDSGAGLGDEAMTWIDSPVVTSDGETIGTLVEVQPVSPTSEAGNLVVSRQDGSGTLDVPLQGASYADGEVTIVPTAAELQDQ
jgi:hypothetical protein